MKRQHRAALVGSLIGVVSAGMWTWQSHLFCRAQARTAWTPVANAATRPSMPAARLVASHNSEPPVLQEPPVPHIPHVSVNVTSLPRDVLKRDVQTLNRLLSRHPGDGMLRGPDELVYNIDAAIDPKQHAVSGHLALHLHNNLDEPITKLYFNVWPNAPHYRAAGGYTAIDHVLVDGASTNFQQDGTVLTLHLNKPLAPDQSAEVQLDFYSLLPHINDRYGWQGSSISLGNWFPILAVHDEYGWITPPYYSDGEPFYSLTGAFHLHISAPDNLVVAISGEQAAPVVQNNGTTLYNYSAIGVRDVAIEADSQYKVMQSTVGHTRVYTYYTPNQANVATSMESVAKQALMFYNKLYGTYPYPTLRICAMNGWFGGMEYPQLVMISVPTDGSQSVQQTNTVVAHEVAHQWFYGLIGDDEFLTPWLDESFATFSEQRLDGNTSPQQRAGTKVHISDPVYSFYDSGFPQATNNINDTGPGDYYTAVYLRGASMLMALRHELGPQKFDRMMRSFVAHYMYQIATTQDFISLVSNALGKDATEWFASHGIVADDAMDAPMQMWAKMEEAENGRTWNGGGRH
ncbi:MAG: M1 family metallopeptidase [Alicyclobacillus sp.]|nr:M1 family metallopeptidase [Alicyclobacillus sp.]